MKVNICGIIHEVEFKEDSFDADLHFGMIEYPKAKIVVNNNLNEQLVKQTICHEMVHGIFTNLGYSDLSSDERLVQSLSNAIYQGFDIKKVEE